MNRDRALKVLLVLVGLLFLAAIYPITGILWHKEQMEYGDAMMLSLYFTLGILLLMGARNPSANRSLIAFTAWSSFAHATVMAIMAYRDPSVRDLLWGSAILVVIGAPLIVLAPPKHPVERVAATGIVSLAGKSPTPASQS